MKQLLYIALAGYFLLISLSGCENKSGSVPEISDSGSIAFNVQWPQATVAPKSIKASKALNNPDLDCEALNIDTVTCFVYNSDNMTIATESWPCSRGEGTIGSIPSQTGITVIIHGKDSEGNILYRGEHTNISVTRNQETNIGTIATKLFSPRLLYPDNGTQLIVNYLSSAQLQWESVEGASEYQVIVSRNNDLSNSIIDNTTTENEFNVSSLSFDTIYYWSVRSIDTNGKYSNYPEVRTASYKKLRNPELKDPDNGTNLSIRFWGVEWEDVEGASAYRVIISENSNLSNPIIDNTTTECIFKPSTLAYDTNYYWSVYSVDMAGDFNLTSSDTKNFLNSRLRWMRDISPVDSSSFSSPAMDSQGNIYIGSLNLYSISRDGIVKWMSPFPENFCMVSSPAIGSDDIIYVGTSDWGGWFDNGTLYAIDSDNGDKIWSKDMIGPIVYSPVIGADGTIYVHPNGKILYAVNPDNTTKWTSKMDFDGYCSSPTIAANGMVYLGCDNGKLYAIEPDNGTQIWDLRVDNSTGLSSPAIDYDGTIWIEVAGGALCAINPDNKTITKTFSDNCGILNTPIIGPDKTIYVAIEESDLHGITAIDPKTGNKNWATNIGSAWSTPALSSGGMIFVGSAFNNSFYAINAETGVVEWTFAIGAGWIFSSPLVDLDGAVYFASSDGFFYAIEGDSGGLATAPWPMFSNDSSHTGRAGDYKNEFGMSFNHLKAGTFLMGPTEHDDTFFREVSLSIPFYLQATTVTLAQWKSVVLQAKYAEIDAANTLYENLSIYSESNESWPMVNVSWWEVKQFIEALNQLSEAGTYRLPTEAEWSYAETSESITHPTAIDNGTITIPNMYEWCEDCYASVWPTQDPVTDPFQQCTSDNFPRVIRYFEDGDYSDRYGHDPGKPETNIGFRLAWEH